MRKHLAKIGIDYTATQSIPWNKALHLAEVASKIEDMKNKEMSRRTKK